jgi:hypothetical protein
VPNIKVVYDTSTGTITIAAHGGLLMEVLRLLTLMQDKHSDLRGLGRESVIPHVNGERVVLLYVWRCSGLS